MVDAQLRGRDVVDERVLAAMDRVPRELFVPEKLRDRAYDDAALPIGEGQTISQPYMVARICEALGLTGSEHVLDVGTGSGYQAAVLAELAEEVDTIERIPALAERARANLVGRRLRRGPRPRRRRFARSAGPGAVRRDRCRGGSARVAAVPLRPARAPGATRGAGRAAGNAAPRGDRPQPGGTGDPPLGSLPFRPSTGGGRVLTRCVRSVRAPWRRVRERTGDELLGLPVRLHGIQLGRPVDLLSIRRLDGRSGSISSAVTRCTASCRCRRRPSTATRSGSPRRSSSSSSTRWTSTAPARSRSAGCAAAPSSGTAVSSELCRTWSSQRTGNCSRRSWQASACRSTRLCDSLPSAVLPPNL